MSANGVDRAVPRLGPALLVCALLALWIDLGSYHREHYADSLIPVLTSLQHWTPFFWGCNRIGMLVPLLALPFAHPLVNLLVQCWLVLFAALAVFVLLPRYLLRSAAWPWAAAAGGLAFLGLLPGWARFYFTFGQPHYVVALALGLGGLLLVEQATPGRRRRLVPALLLLLLACWVNSASPLFLGGLALLRGLLLYRQEAPGAWPALRGWLDDEAGWSLLLLGCAALAVWLVQCCVPAPVDTVGQGLLPIQRWPAAWGCLALHAMQACGWAFFTLPMALAAGLFLAPAVRRQAGPAGRAALVLLGAAALQVLAMGTLKWVTANQLDCRYVLPAILYAAAALAILAAAPLAAVLGPSWRRGLARAAIPALFLTAAGGYGFPSLQRVRNDVAGWQVLSAGQQQAIGPVAHEVAAAGCTHLAGCYWTVWPTVFLANLELAERGQKRRVWGVSERSLPTQKLWKKLPADEVRLGVRATSDGMEPEAAGYLAAYFPGLQVREKHSGLWVLRTPAEGVEGTASVP